MGKHTVFVVLVLAAVWIILMEELSLVSVAMGVVIGFLVALFTKKFLPYQEIKNVKLLKLVTYPFFLIGQIYAAGFVVIKIIARGSVVDIVTIKTRLKNETLRVILADSVTLTPGSILLNLDGDELSLLWIHSKKTLNTPDIARKQLIEKLERRLLKAEKDT